MPTITAYTVGDPDRLTFEPASPKRAWMEALPDQFAKRCLPLLMANASGWVGRTPIGFSAIWTGGPEKEALHIIPEGDPDKLAAASHFGHGILTFTMPFLFRTDPGVNLLVRGPANEPRDGISPLEGLVETDWSRSTFTMNWKFTRPGPVRFAANDAVVMVVPQARGDLESYDCRIADLDEDPETADCYRHWSTARNEFNRKLHDRDPEACKQGWQKEYFRGQNHDGSRSDSHQTNRKLRRF